MSENSLKKSVQNNTHEDSELPSKQQQICNTLESKSSAALNCQKHHDNVSSRPKTSKPKQLRDPENDIKKSKVHIKLGVSPPNGKYLKIVKQANDSKLISQGINKKLKL